MVILTILVLALSFSGQASGPNAKAASPQAAKVEPGLNALAERAVITVGAINTHDTPARSDDTVASYSSRGPTAIEGLIKPDILAPGNKVVSTTSPSTTLRQS